MTTYTLLDLMYAKGTSEPVRQALQAQADEIERLRKALSYCAYPEMLHPMNQATYLVARKALENKHD